MLFKFLGTGDDKRRHRRRDYDQFSSVQIGGSTIRGQLVDLSEGGCLFHPEFSVGFVSDKRLVLSVGDARIDCELIRRSQDGLHCRFLTQLSKRQLETLMSAKSQAFETRTRVASRGDDGGGSVSPQDRWRMLATKTAAGSGTEASDEPEAAAPQRQRPLATVASSLFKRLRREGDAEPVEQDRSHVLARLRQQPREEAAEVDVAVPDSTPAAETAVARPPAETLSVAVEVVPPPVEPVFRAPEPPPPAEPAPPLTEPVVTSREPSPPPAELPPLVELPPVIELPAPVAPVLSVPRAPVAPDPAMPPAVEPAPVTGPEHEWRRQMTREKLRRRLEQESGRVIAASMPETVVALLPTAHVPAPTSALDTLRASLEAELEALSEPLPPSLAPATGEPDDLATSFSGALDQTLEALHRRLGGQDAADEPEDDRLGALRRRLAEAVVEEPPAAPPDSLPTADWSSTFPVAAPEPVEPPVASAPAAAIIPAPPADEPSSRPPIRSGLRHLLGEPDTSPPIETSGPGPAPWPPEPERLEPPEPVAPPPAATVEPDVAKPAPASDHAPPRKARTIEDVIERLRVLVGEPDVGTVPPRRPAGVASTASALPASPLAAPPLAAPPPPAPAPVNQPWLAPEVASERGRHEVEAAAVVPEMAIEQDAAEPVDALLDRLRTLIAEPEADPLATAPAGAVVPASGTDAVAVDEEPVPDDDLLERLRRVVVEPPGGDSGNPIADEQDSASAVEDLLAQVRRQLSEAAREAESGKVPGDEPLSAASPAEPPTVREALRYPGDDEPWTLPVPTPSEPPAVRETLRYPGDDEPWTPPAVAPAQPEPVRETLRYPGDDEPWSPPAAAPAQPQPVREALRYPGDDEPWTPPAAAPEMKPSAETLRYPGDDEPWVPPSAPPVSPPVPSTELGSPEDLPASEHRAWARPVAGVGGDGRLPLPAPPVSPPASSDAFRPSVAGGTELAPPEPVAAPQPGAPQQRYPGEGEPWTPPAAQDDLRAEVRRRMAQRLAAEGREPASGPTVDQVGGQPSSEPSPSPAAEVAQPAGNSRLSFAERMARIKGKPSGGDDAPPKFPFKR